MASSAEGKLQVALTTNDSGDGGVSTYSAQGNELISLGSSKSGDGAFLSIKNKTGTDIIQAYTDEYGHGYLGVFDRNGKGRVIRPEL